MGRDAVKRRLVSTARFKTGTAHDPTEENFMCNFSRARPGDQARYNFEIMLATTSGTTPSLTSVKPDHQLLQPGPEQL